MSSPTPNITTYIYGLRCPIAEKVRYVGRTSAPARRFKEHASLREGKTDTKKGRPLKPRDAWLKELVETGHKPELVILETFDWHHPGLGYWPPDPEEAKDAEREWTRRLADAGHPLTNHACDYGTTKIEEERIVADALVRGRKLAAALGVEPRELRGS
jgi:hypothetical protein